MFNRRLVVLSVVVASVLLATLGSSKAHAMSIETSDPKKPFKVTHKNSGPEYDIDLQSNEALSSSDSAADSVEKRKVMASGGEVEQTTPRPSEQDSSMDSPTLGHVTIRRIFLVPMAAPPSRDTDNQQQYPADSGGSFGLRPFWPFLTPPAPMIPSAESEERPMPGMFNHNHHHRHHLFGADQASRSPTTEQIGERESMGSSATMPIGTQQNQNPFDPIRMMIEMMQHAVNERFLPPQMEPQDMNKEASGGDKKDTNEMESPEREQERKKETAGSDQKPVTTVVNSRKPQSHNETKEEIVEIEGKKYLKKSVINRHVGENIIFMTKRLIFVPLNETESSSSPSTPTTTTTTTTAPVTQPPIAATTASSDPKIATAEPDTNSSQSTRTTTTAATPQPEATSSTTTTTTTSAPSAKPAADVEEVTSTTKSPSLLDRVSDAIDKAAERIVEKAKEELTSGSTTTTVAT